MSLETIDGRLVIIGGASRSGKTGFTVDEVKADPRILVFDTEAQWCEIPGFKKITSKAELVGAVQSKGNAKLAFVPSVDLKGDFDLWSGCVYHWGKYHGPCTAVAEELADVTSPGKAPGSWGILNRRGLKRGISIYAISQRWAEADKTSFGNASEFIFFRQSSFDDVRYIAKKTRLDIQHVDNLDDLEYVRYNPKNNEYTREKLPFNPSKANK